MEDMNKKVLIADRNSRRDSQSYYDRHMPEIMYRKNFNFEKVMWTCPYCNVDNKASVHIYSTLGYQPIITPRVYYCHNSKCHVRRFYWRDAANQLFAQFLGKYDSIDELEFTSAHDPMKFYIGLKPFIPNQTTMF
jgi:hypothetical protein